MSDAEDMTSKAAEHDESEPIGQTVRPRPVRQAGYFHYLQEGPGILDAHGHGRRRRLLGLLTGNFIYTQIERQLTAERSAGVH